MMINNFRNKLSIQFRRKAAHIVFGTLVFFLPDIFSKGTVIIALIIALSAFTLARILGTFSAIRDYPVKSYGEIFFPLGLMIAGLAFLPENPLAFKFGILISTFSDALAAIFGANFGKHRLHLYGREKTLEGSLAFFLSAWPIAWVFSFSFPGGNIAAAAILALLLTFAELLFILGADNLILPLISGQLMLLAFGG